MSLIDDAIEVQNQSTAALSENDDTVTLTESELAALKDLWKYYSVKTWCWNYDKPIYRYVKKGVPKEHINADCDNCGVTVNLKRGKP